MQINISQYVLVRIPRTLGLFDSSKTISHRIGMGALLSRKATLDLDSLIRKKDTEPLMGQPETAADEERSEKSEHSQKSRLTDDSFRRD